MTVYNLSYSKGCNPTTLSCLELANTWGPKDIYRLCMALFDIASALYRENKVENACEWLIKCEKISDGGNKMKVLHALSVTHYQVF